MRFPQVTYYKDCDRSLLVFVWSHALCDVEGGLTFLNRWLRGTAIATTAARWADGTIIINDDVDAAVQASSKKVADTDIDPGLWRFERMQYYGKPSAGVLARLLEQPDMGLGPPAAPAWPPILKTPEWGAGGELVGDDSSSSSGGYSSRNSISSSVQKACREWLATHECHFPVSSMKAQRPPPLYCFAPFPTRTPTSGSKCCCWDLRMHKNCGCK